METLRLDEITKRIVNTIMVQPYLDSKSLTETIRPIIKIWFDELARQLKERGIYESNNKSI
jgi:hypothetical protein